MVLKKPLRAAEVERRVRELLSAKWPDDELRARLEELAREPAFGGLTWLWGSSLYRRNRVLFRPFIRAHFSTWAFDPPTRSAPVSWQDGRGAELEHWLGEVDRNDDVELFRLLYAWKRTGARWRLDAAAVRADLAERFAAARTPGERRLVLAKFGVGFPLDEGTALGLYERDPAAAAPFVLQHLPHEWRWLGGEKRALWTRLVEAAAGRHDEDFRLALWRKQVPLPDWEREIMDLAERVGGPIELCGELQKRHLEGFNLNLGDAFLRLVERRGRDVFPYVMRHLTEVWRGLFWRSGGDRLLELARSKGYWDLWAAVLRTCSSSKEFDREVLRLLGDGSLAEGEVRGRLLLLCGVAREWNFGGFGVAAVHLLEDVTAVKLYGRFPELLRGPLKAHVAPSWNHAYPKLIERLVAAGDEELLDFMASRLVTRLSAWAKDLLAAAERMAGYYEAVRKDEDAFARRACAVLSQVPAYSIYNYHGVIRENRLARILFERSSSRYLADASGLRDLVEAPEIHVQALAYRALGQDDPRARELAAANVDMLLGTLLRPLRRTTRTIAFRALANAAGTLEVARRVHDRAREALALPDKRYPKELLVGLIGRLLARWPELQGPTERPVVFGAEGRP